MSHYRPYPAYRDSGVEWIGQVPEHWEVARIKRHATLRTERCNDLPAVVTYIGLEDVEAESGLYKPTDGNSRQSDDSTVGIFYKGDVLYGKLRPYLRKAIIADRGGACSTEFLVMNTRETLPRWLHQWLLTPNVTQQIEAGCEGTKMPRADWEHVGSIELAAPDQREQAQILSVLDREIARIDALIAKKTRFIELLKEKHHAFITYAVTKGLNPDVLMKDSGVEWIGAVPERWGVKQLRHVASFTNSNVDKKVYDGQQTVSLCSYTDVYYNEFITADLQFMQATASISEIEQFSLKKGDVIITKDSEDPSDIGIPSLVAEDISNVVCSYHLTMIRTPDIDTSRFMHRVLQSHPTKAHFFVESSGITRYGLSQGAIGDLRACFPPQKDRSVIADCLDRETARIDALIVKSQRSINLLKERRAAFITAAVTGQIDLRHQHE